MLNLVIVGLGQAFRKHWVPILSQSKQVNIICLVEPDINAQLYAETLLNQGVRRHRSNVRQLQELEIDLQNSVCLILTPDHLIVVKELANLGFKKFIVEKPPVSRYEEIKPFEELIRSKELQVYCVDQYLAKTFSLQCLLEKIGLEDPHMSLVRSQPWIEISHVSRNLGTIEGVAVNIIEGGDFGLTDLKARPWLRYDQEVGGVLKDLGTHAFAPLIEAGLLSVGSEIMEMKQSYLSQDDHSLKEVGPDHEVETYISCLLLEKELYTQAAFGKVPGGKGVWSLVVRFENGMYYAGLREGQPSVVVFNSGDVVNLPSPKNPVEFVIGEADMYFKDQLTEFDGHTQTLLDSLKLLQRLSAS